MFYFIQFIVTAKRVKMSDSQSLLTKYPHLKTLLKENNEKKKEDIAPPRVKQIPSVRRARDPINLQPCPGSTLQIVDPESNPASQYLPCRFATLMIFHSAPKQALLV